MKRPAATLADQTPPATGGKTVVTSSVVIASPTEILRDGAVALAGETILDVGPAAKVLASHPDAMVIDGTGFTLMPGLVNAHTHAAMGFFRGLGHGKSEMIETFLFPAEKSLTPELLEPLSYSYLVAGLKAGVTTFGDHYYFVDGVARAIDRLGLRGAVGETVADLGGAFSGTDGWKKWRAAIDAWPHSSRVTPVVAPHAADTVSAKLLKELSSFAKTRGLPLHMHLSQTTGERERVMAREGLSPVAYAEKAGALGPTTLAVHLVTADVDDLARLAAAGTTVGFCPASQIIYEKLAPFAEMIRAGLSLALGTDCAASNDGTDLLGETRLAALLARDRGLSEKELSDADLFAMSTVNGAKALGYEERIGRLVPGAASDIVCLEDGIGTLPDEEPLTNLLYSRGAADVRHVMVDGRFVLWQGRTTLVDERDLTTEYRKAVGEISRRLGRASP